MEVAPARLLTVELEALFARAYKVLAGFVVKNLNIEFQVEGSGAEVELVVGDKHIEVSPVSGDFVGHQRVSGGNLAVGRAVVVVLVVEFSAVAVFEISVRADFVAGKSDDIKVEVNHHALETFANGVDFEPYLVDFGSDTRALAHVDGRRVIVGVDNDVTLTFGSRVLLTCDFEAGRCAVADGHKIRYLGYIPRWSVGADRNFAATARGGDGDRTHVDVEIRIRARLL